MLLNVTLGPERIILWVCAERNIRFVIIETHCTIYYNVTYFKSMFNSIQALPDKFK